MIKPLRFIGILLLLLCPAIASLAQSLPVGTPVIEDAYRRQQLLGRLDTSVSFTIRPLFPASAFDNPNVFDPYHNLSPDGRETNVIYRTRDGLGVVKALPITYIQQVNTHNPYGWNDGAMIPAAGYQTLLSAGIYAKYKFLSIRLQPELVVALNKNFNGFTQAGNSNQVWTAFYALNNNIDVPERFGTGVYRRFLPGQSSILFTFEPIAFGLSTENLWWGPGIRNSLVMSNNARGFAHLTFNTTRPVKTPVGTFETQLVAGKLEGSGFSPLVLGQTGNHDQLYVPKPNDWRYLSALVFTYQPKWVPGLFLGFTRSFQVYHKDMGHGFSDYLPIFTSFFKSSFTDPNTGINSEDAAKRDQLASLFARWVWPEANAEIYGEYGREDHNYNVRDLLLDPEHSRAYTLGFRKLFNIGAAEDHIQVSVEETQLGKPADDVINRNQTPGWYANNQVRAGYTNNGEVLGAGIGPGSGLQSLDVSWLRGLTKIGMQLERYEHNADFYYKAFAAGETRRHWVDYSAGLNGEWAYDHLIFSAQILYIKELNYQWELKPDPTLNYYGQQNYDATNLKFTFAIGYRF